MPTQHPVFRIVRHDQGRSWAWLARGTGYSHVHVRAMACGQWRCTPRFRAACARLLEMDETLLFHDDTSSSADQRGGTPETGSGEPPAYAHDAARPIRATA